MVSALSWEMRAEKVQNALNLSEERFRLLVDSVSDYAIFILDPDGKIVSWNPGAQRLKGYTPDEILGQHFSIFYPEEDRQVEWRSKVGGCGKTELDSGQQSPSPRCAIVPGSLLDSRKSRAI
jgi:PAS domain-containing protein